MIILSLLCAFLFGMSLPLGCTYISHGNALIYWKVLRTLGVWMTLLASSVSSAFHTDIHHIIPYIGGLIIVSILGFFTGSITEKMFSAIIKGDFISLWHNNDID